MQPIYVVIGVPGAGKTWVLDQLEDKFKVIPHDKYLDDREGYPAVLAREAIHSPFTILGDLVFGISEPLQYLKAAGAVVTPFFIIETDRIIRSRYLKREKKAAPERYYSLQKTYLERAKELKAFHGTSEEVLMRLKSL